MEFAQSKRKEAAFSGVLLRRLLLISMQTMTFAAKFEFLDEIRDFVGGIARSNGFGAKDIYNIQLATDEAASNIIEHAYEGADHGQIDISCDYLNGNIIVILRDMGVPFDPSAIPVPNLTADLSERQIGGLGTFLMRKLMDEVHYVSKPTGNYLTMTKRKG